MVVLEESTTSSASKYSRLSKGLRILEKEIDLEKKPEGRVSIVWEDEVEGVWEVRCSMLKGKDGRGKECCLGRVSGGLERG